MRRILPFIPAMLNLVMPPAGIAEDPAEPIRIRVLAYNIHHGEGVDRKFDLQRYARIIKDAKADLVALQEVDVKTRRSSGVDQAAELARLTGMHYVFGEFFEFQGGRYGQAILSRFPIRRTENPTLPRGPEPRASLVARIPLGENGPEVALVGTHLYGSPEQRLAQAKTVHRFFAGEPSTPIIVAGDFNSLPGSPTMVEMMKHYTDASDRSPTYSDRKIDYILYRPKERFRVVSYRVIPEEVASDHRPIVAEVELLPAAARRAESPGRTPAERESPGKGSKAE